MASSKSFIKANSQSEMPRALGGPASGGSISPGGPRALNRLDSMRGGSVSDYMSEDNFGPLSNVR